MTKIEGVLETSLYVADLARSLSFYRDVFGLELMLETPRLIALDAGRRTVLLIFPNNAEIPTIHDARGVVPGHGGSGRGHIAFAIATDELDDWRARLASRHVAITGEYEWPRGGRSLYFDDPDGNVVELATPGLWPTY